MSASQRLGRPATMNDVAARARVSRSLVSAVMRGIPGASETTRQRILESAAELGYRPDERARLLRSNRSRQLGVTLTAIHPFHAALAEHIHDAAERAGYDVTMTLVTAQRPLDRAVDVLLRQRVDALLIVGPTDPPADIVALAAQAPTIVVDGCIDEVGMDALRVDDAAGLRMAIGHLAGLGHRDIWHVDGGDWVSAAPRRAGYLAAMDDAGLRDHARVVPGGGTGPEGARAADRIVDEGRLPTALAVYNDLAAIGLMDALAHRGVLVPRDVSVVGFDDIPEADLAHVQLTTIVQRSGDLADAAVARAIARAEGAEPEGLRLLTPALTVRSSTAAPRT